MRNSWGCHPSIILLPCLLLQLLTGHKVTSQYFVPPSFTEYQMAQLIQNGIVDVEKCYASLHKADDDPRDGRLTSEEYVAFTQGLAPDGLINVNDTFVDFPLILQSNYFVLACLCDTNENPLCCVGDNAHVPTSGSGPGDTPTEDEISFLFLVCWLTQSSIDRYAATILPTSLPSPFPTTPPLTSSPTPLPTDPPTKGPTPAPTRAATPAPTSSPTRNPTIAPTVQGTGMPTPELTVNPTLQPSPSPTVASTGSPSSPPTKVESNPPTIVGTKSPTVPPSPGPTNIPTTVPSQSPTAVPPPSVAPTSTPTVPPTASPAPSQSPTTLQPTATSLPSVQPTTSPSSGPTEEGRTIAPTPASIDVVGRATYSIVVKNGKQDNIPQPAYTTDLIDAMDVLATQIVNELEDDNGGRQLRSSSSSNNYNVNTSNRRRFLTIRVSTPTSIDGIIDAGGFTFEPALDDGVFTIGQCPADLGNPDADRCEEVTASVGLFLSDDESALRVQQRFQVALVEAVTTTRLQKALEVVNPASVVSIISGMSSSVTPPPDTGPTPAPLTTQRTLSGGARAGVVTAAAAVLVVMFLLVVARRPRDDKSEEPDLEDAEPPATGLEWGDDGNGGKGGRPGPGTQPDSADDRPGPAGGGGSGSGAGGAAVPVSTTGSGLIGAARPDYGHGTDSPNQPKRPKISGPAVAGAAAAAAAGGLALAASSSSSSSTSSKPQTSSAEPRIGAAPLPAPYKKPPRDSDEYNEGADLMKDTSEISPDNLSYTDAYSAGKSSGGKSSGGGKSSISYENSSGWSDVYTSSIGTLESDELMPGAPLVDLGGDSGLVAGQGGSNPGISTLADLEAAITSGDWAAVGATAALLASSQYDSGNSQSKSSLTSGVSSVRSRSSSWKMALDAKKAAELDQLIEHGNWEGVIQAAAKFEAENTGSQSSSHSRSQSRSNSLSDGEGDDEDGEGSGSGSRSGSFSASGSHPGSGYNPSLASASGSGSGSGSATNPSTITTSDAASIKNKSREEIRKEVVALVERVVPEELDHVDEMMAQFKGREDELLETLRTMQERDVAQKARKVTQRQAKLEASGRVERDVRRIAAIEAAEARHEAMEAGQPTSEPIFIPADSHSAARGRSGSGSGTRASGARGGLPSSASQTLLSGKTDESGNVVQSQTDSDEERRRHRDALFSAIDSGNWDAVGEAAAILSDTTSTNTKSLSRTMESVRSGSSGGSRDRRKRKEELAQMVEQGDWLGVVAAASRYSEMDKKPAAVAVAPGTSIPSSSSSSAERISNEESLRRQQIREEQEALRQAEVWLEVARQTKRAQGIDPEGDAAAAEAADWAIARSLSLLQSKGKITGSSSEEEGHFEDEQESV